MTMIDYYLLRARVSFCVCKNSCHVVQKLPCCLSGSSLSSDIATQVTCIVIAQCSSKFSSSDVVTCFLLSGGLVFFSSSPHHIGGSSRVAEAMSEVEQDPLNQQKTDEEKKSDSPSPKRSRSPHRKDQALVGGSIAGGLPGNDQDQKS